MSIVPVGKIKSQVVQGLSRNSTILNNDIFKAAKTTKIAVTGLDELQSTPDAKTQPEQVPANNDVENAMMDSRNPQMNVNNLENGNDSREIPPGAKFNPYDGTPLAGITGGEVLKIVKESLANYPNLGYEIRGDPDTGDWQLTINPGGKLSPGGRSRR